tara:strand:+ start:352 stop:966 length:615 start_codon:yes stop_codon:yes gene_type:complete
MISNTSVTKQIKYRLSFGTGNAYINESNMILKKYLENKDWRETEKYSVENNILQTNTLSSTKRIFREISLRLKSLSHQEQEFFIRSNYLDQSILIWIAICRTYKFIGDFASMMISEKFSCYQIELDYNDFNYFYEQQKVLYEELNSLKDSTRKKLRQVIFKIMKDLNIISKSKEITPLLPSKEIKEISINTTNDMQLFLPGFLI